MANADPALDADGPHHVHVCLENARDRELLTELLSPSCRVTTGPPPDGGSVDEAATEMEPTASTVDLFVVDVASFRRHRDAIDAYRTRLAPEFLPVVLLQPQKRGSVPDDVFDAVDELVETPLSRRRLEKRLASLLRSRDQSRQLARQRRNLELLNRIVRHDIRNDMGIVIGWGEALGEHVDEEGGDQLDRMLAASEHVVELTKTARDLVEAMVGGETIELEPVDAGEVLRREVAKAQSGYGNAVFTVDGEIPDATTRANELLASVFRNLLNNAVVHSDEETPEITVSATVEDDTFVVRIADNGPGISADQKARLFRKGAKGLDSPGTGLGLYLVDSLTTQYGGRISVEDNDPKGAVFVVELPVA